MYVSIYHKSILVHQTNPVMGLPLMLVSVLRGTTASEYHKCNIGTTHFRSNTYVCMYTYIYYNIDISAPDETCDR